MPAKRAFREKWSELRFQRKLTLEIADSQISHAKWAAKTLARNMFQQQNDRITGFERGQLRQYGVQPALLDFATQRLNVELAKMHVARS